MLKVIFILLLGTLPGAYALVAARKLYRRLDDPLLPDLVLAHARSLGAFAGIAFGLGAFLLHDHVIEVGLVVLVSLLAGNFPLRKRIFDESWSLFAFLGHTLRFWLGALGSLVLIASIPSAMALAGERSALAGSLVGAGALVWSYFGSSVLLRLVRAKPLTSSELQEPFARIRARANCSTPALFEAEASGGTWVNAFALPSVRGSGVLFTRGLLDALTSPETTAIYAHEIAHLEHYTRRKLVLGHVLTLVLAATPVILWSGAIDGGDFRSWAWIWPPLLFVGFVAAKIRHRAHEAESDRRAVELSGDPEALVSALTKIHALMRVSRRWSEDQERFSSHPSLARRIQAIRAAGSSSTSTPPAEGVESIARLFRAADSSGRAVLFDDAAVHWLRGLPADGRDLLARSRERRSIPYGELRDLRLVGTLRERRLIFTDASRRTCRLPISAEDVAELDGLLDRVDDRLGYTPARSGGPSGRIWSSILFVFGLLPSLWSLIVLGALALVRPIEGTLAALGAGALAAAAWRLLRPGLGLPWLPSWCLLIVGSAGVACLVAARKARRRGSEQTARELLLAVLVPLALVLVSSLGAMLALLSVLPWMHLHLWARESLTALIGLLASAAALATWPRPRARVGSAALVVLAAGLLFAGSLAFRERASGDVFRSMGRPFPIRGAGLEQIREVDVPATVSELWLSPRGTSFAVATVAPRADERYRPPGATEFLASAGDGSLSSIRALAVGFLDEDRLAVLEEDRGRMVLRVVPLSNPSSGAVVHEMPLLSGPRLWTSADSGAWRVLGQAMEDHDELIALEGKLDSDEIEERHYPLEGGEGASVTTGRQGWALSTFYELFQNPRWGSASPFLYAFTLSSGSHMVVELRVGRPGDAPRSIGKTALLPTCLSGPPGEPRFFCTASDGERTGVWSFEPTSGSWEPLGFVSGDFYARESPSLEGRRLVLSGWNAEPVLVQLNRRTVLLPSREPTPGSSRRDWGIVAWNGETLASARRKAEGDETTVSFYTVYR